MGGGEIIPQQQTQLDVTLECDNNRVPNRGRIYMQAQALWEELHNDYISAPEGQPGEASIGFNKTFLEEHAEKGQGFIKSACQHVKAFLSSPPATRAGFGSDKAWKINPQAKSDSPTDFTLDFDLQSNYGQIKFQVGHKPIFKGPEEPPMGSGESTGFNVDAGTLRLDGSTIQTIGGSATYWSGENAQGGQQHNVEVAGDGVEQNTIYGARPDISNPHRESFLSAENCTSTYEPDTRTPTNLGDRGTDHTKRTYRSGENTFIHHGKGPMTINSGDGEQHNTSISGTNCAQTINYYD